jgi:hypothetical protein
MNEMALYKLLQQHVGDMNQLVLALFNGQIAAADAQAQSTAKIEAVLATLKA